MTRSLRLFLSARYIVFALVALLLLTVSAVAQPVPPNRFFGRVIVNGDPGVLTEIVAYVNGVECGRAKADEQGRYRVDVISAGEKEGCGTPGAPVGFTVNGAFAQGVGNWQQGEFTPFDIVLGAGGAFATQRTPPSDESAANTRLIVVIIAVAVVAFIGTGAYLYFRSRRTPA